MQNVKKMEVDDYELLLKDKLSLTGINTLFNELRSKFIYYRDLFTDGIKRDVNGRMFEPTEVPWKLRRRIDILSGIINDT